MGKDLFNHEYQDRVSVLNLTDKKTGKATKRHEIKTKKAFYNAKGKKSTDISAP